MKNQNYAIEMHGVRVANYAHIIAQEMGLSPKEIAYIEKNALFHDVGKAELPSTIFLKTTPLTAEEWQVIKQHPLKGAELLENNPETPNLEVGAKYHHENYDGTGYPFGLSGEKIPLVARIIALADAIDVMHTGRFYSAARSEDYIVSELKNNSGKRFDPHLTVLVLKMIKQKKILIKAEQ